MATTSPYMYNSISTSTTLETWDTSNLGRYEPMVSLDNKPVKPEKKKMFNAFESSLIQFINTNIMNVSAAVINMLYSPLSLTHKVFQDMKKSEETNYKHTSRQVCSYEFLSFVPPRNGVANIIFIDGVLEFIPNMMAQALFLKSALMQLRNGTSGYVFIKFYSSAELKEKAKELNLEIVPEGFQVDLADGKKSIITGIDRSEIIDMLAYGRIGSRSGLGDIYDKEYICLTNSY
jgi:hypothetical protein